MKLYLLLLTTFFSCSVVKNGSKAKTIGVAIDLNFLSNYKTRTDSAKNRQVVYYDSLSLKKELIGDNFFIYLGDKLVYEGIYTNTSYLFEVFKKKYLLISIVPGKSSAAGPDLFERDSVVVLNIATAKMTKVNLQKIYLTRSADFLFKAYKCPTDTLKFRNEYNRYCAIDSIDMTNRKILLINQCHQAEEFKMTTYR